MWNVDQKYVLNNKTKTFFMEFYYNEDRWPINLQTNINNMTNNLY